MGKLNVLECFVNSFMEENHNGHLANICVKNLYKHLCKTQAKILKVVGPLTRLRAITCGTLEGNSERVSLTVEDMNELIDQSSTMLGQTYVLSCKLYRVYHVFKIYHTNFIVLWRIQTLTSLLNDTQAKRMFKENASLLSQIQKMLFGESFKSDWYQTENRTKISTKSQNIPRKLF